MSDAPKTIWASQCGKLIVQDFMERLSVDIEYTRTDHCDAIIAADREAIAQFFDAKAEDMRRDGSAAYQGDVLGTLEYVSQAIRARTPADAQAALAARDKRVRDEALRECLEIVGGWHDNGNKPGDLAVLKIEAAILAMIDAKPTTPPLRG